MAPDRIAPRIMKTAIAGTFLAFAAAVALGVFLWPSGNAHAQSMQELCQQGTAVENPQANPGLVSDCAALLASRDTLRGSDDAMPLNWSSDVPMGDWNGVTVAGSPPRVTKLSFSEPFASMGSDKLPALLNAPFLKGSIPPELGGLSMLEELHLSYNGLSGGIPNQLGNLANLTQLYLSYNNLSGRIPKQFGNLRNLTHLDLSHNQLRGRIPRQLGRLSNLEQLLLNTNNLKGGIPKRLGNLESLTQLWLKENDLKGGIPSELGNLDGLTVLWLDVKNLEGGVPEELDEFRGRTAPWLKYDDVHVSEQPRTIKYSLLWAAENQPENLDNLSNARYLWFSRNQPPVNSLGMSSYKVLGENERLGSCVFPHLRWLEVTYPSPGDLDEILGLPWCDEEPPTDPVPTPTPDP